MENKFQLLCEKKILKILIGDEDINLGEITVYGSDKKIKLSMPYLKGSEICDISNYFGLPVSYALSGAKSRWIYMKELFEYCIATKKESQLLSYLFSIKQFKGVLHEFKPNIIENTYKQITDSIIEHINGELRFDGNELVQINGVFYVKEINKSIAINTPCINTIDRNYISDLSNRAIEDIENGHYDSALTKSRTLLEEVFCYVIENKNVNPSDKGDISKLYKQVKDLYNMHAEKELDHRINELLSGLEKILNSISAMRNRESDSHGVGKNRFSIAEHHARLYVNASMTMSDFILSVAENVNKKA